MCKTFQKSAITLLTTLLVACGGGGDVILTTPSSNYQTPVAINTFVPLSGTTSGTSIMEIYNRDLNNDGIDEVMVAGRKSQPSTSADWQNFNVQIYGWNTGSFTNETSTWFSGSDNVITGTDQAVKFGDFDGDNNIDVIMGASTDDTTRSIYGRITVFFNNGNDTFTRSVLPGATYWQHDLIVHDFNNDNRDDFLATDYGDNTLLGFGNADDTFTTHSAGNASYSASGLSVADYIAGGELEVIMSDSGISGNPKQDTNLFSWLVVDPAVSGALTLADSGKTLPATPVDALDHAVRNLAMDFNNDGDVDVVVFQRPLTTHTLSTVQFLQNDGAGNFTDVTNTTLVNYTDASSGDIYQPVIADFNGDGLSDIILGDQILVQSSDGKFVGSYNNVYVSFKTDIDAIVNSDWSTDGERVKVVKGPNSEYYLAGQVAFEVFSPANIFKSTFFLAKIGVKPSTTTQTATELADNVWPYSQ